MRTLGIKNSRIVSTALIAVLLLINNACFENPSLPVLTTKEPAEITQFSFVSGGIITDAGESEIFQKGVCLNYVGNPTLKDLYTTDGFGSDDFESLVLPVEAGKKIYVRSYAINSAGIAYGNDVSLLIEKIYSVNVYIESWGDVTGYSAFFRIYVLSEGEVFDRGLCWGTAPDPTIANSKAIVGSGTGNFTYTITGLTPGTSYYVRPFAYNNKNEIVYGNAFNFTTKNFPTLTTKELKNTETFIVTSGGDITSTSSIITENGVCWSTHSSPTINDNRTTDYLNYSSFTSDLKGLSPGETYFVRAYAISEVGVSYGNERSITMPAATVFDIDGNPYSSVTIGSQTWLVENLKTTRYANGDPINNLVDLTAWSSTTSGAWCNYENTSSFDHPYGKLYNWYAAVDARNVCPSGWHVPDDGEWSTLFNYLGGASVAGDKMREAGTAHWKLGNYNATNSSGFTALPGGARSLSLGLSYPVYSLGMFWSSVESSQEEALGYYLTDFYTQVTQLKYIKQIGMSVRCLKD